MITNVNVIFVCVNVETLYLHLYLNMSQSCHGLLTFIFILTFMDRQGCMPYMGVLAPQIVGAVVVWLQLTAIPMAQVLAAAVVAVAVRTLAAMGVQPLAIIVAAAALLHIHDPFYSTNGMLKCNFNKLPNSSSLLNPNYLSHWMALALHR